MTIAMWLEGGDIAHRKLIFEAEVAVENYYGIF
jgi:hypothetical protein